MVEFGGIPDINLKNARLGDKKMPEDVKLTPEEIALFGDISGDSCPVNSVPESIFGTSSQASLGFPTTGLEDFSPKSRYISEPESLRKTAQAKPVTIEPAETQKTEEVESSDTSSKKHKVTIGDMELDMDISKSVNENGDTIFSGEVRVDGGIVKYKRTKSEDGESTVTVFIGDDSTMRAECSTDDGKVKNSSVEQRYMDENGNVFSERETETEFKETGIKTSGYGYSNSDGNWIDFQDAYDQDGNYVTSAYTQGAIAGETDPVTIYGKTVLSSDGSGFEFVPSDTNSDVIAVQYGEGIVSTRQQVPQDASSSQHSSLVEQGEVNTSSIISSEPQHIEDLPDVTMSDSVPQVPVEEQEPFIPDFLGDTNQLYRTQNKN